MVRIINLDFQEEFIEKVLAAVLRTPGLILCDYWHQQCLEYSFPKSFGYADVTDASLNSTVLILGIYILLLPYDCLVNLYLHVISATLMILAEIMSRVYVEEELALFESPAKQQMIGTSSYYKRQLLQGLSVASVSVLVAWCLGIKNRILKWIPNIYLAPIMIRLLDYPLELLPLGLKSATSISLLFTGIYLLYMTPTYIAFTLRSAYNWQLLARFYGNGQAFMILLTHLLDPIQFILYWIALFFNQIWIEYIKFQEKNLDMSEVGEWYLLLLLIVSEICYTPLTLIASCLAVMAFSNGVIRVANCYLDSCKPHAPPSTAVLSGITEGMVMFLLSLQTGLIDMKLPQRLGAMSIILFIVAASLFQTVLEITHPVLLALSASSRNISSHFKVLVLCLLLCLVPAYMSHLLISTVDLDLWTMVVISSSLLTSIQVVGHLIHYLLYLWDSFKPEPLENLDDYIYYLKSLVHALEVMSALFVVCAGIKEAVSGHWSLLNSVVLVVHCYFNVWIRIKSGWSSFLMRQAAVNRIQTLKDATEEDLKKYNDVCSICYSEMEKNAKLTPCGHIFHGGCLKKWLYVQDHCPMCSSNVIEDQNVDQVGTETNVVHEDNTNTNMPPPPPPPAPILNNVEEIAENQN